MKEADKKSDKKSGITTMKCENIQSVLFDYMARELGSAHTHLIREHLRKCDECRTSAAEIQATLDLLRDASESNKQIPIKLSKRRRDRIYRAVMHPVWNWVSINHFIVSIIIMGLVIAAILLIMRNIEPWRTGDPMPNCVPVNIGHKPATDTHLNPLIKE